MSKPTGAAWRNWKKARGRQRKAAGLVATPDSWDNDWKACQLGDGFTDPVEPTLPPSPELTAEEIIEYRMRKFERKRSYEVARQLINVDVPITGPYGILHFGDPHVDDDGTDLRKLKHDIKTVKDTPGLFAANIGDTRNNWVGRLSRLYGEQGVSAKEALILANWFLRELKGKWIYLIGGNHDCLTPSSECLTARGWVNYQDIRDDDQVLSIDRETGKSVWSPILGRIERDHDGELVCMKTQSITMEVTPNHRVLAKKRNWLKRWGKYEFVQAGKLPSRVAIPVSAPGSTYGCTLSDDQITLAGWILTEGSISWQGNSPRISIYQSKDGNEITRLLQDLQIEHTVTTRVRDIKSVCGRDLVKSPLPQAEWRLNATGSRKVLSWVPKKGELPFWSKELTDRQFDVLLGALIAGDGTWDGANPQEKTCGVLHGEREFLGSVQACAVSHGWSARMSMARDNDWRLNLVRRQDLQTETKGATTTVNYTGKVWCLTVPHGNFMIRNNGSAYFTGNCWSGADDPLEWIASQINALYEPSEARLNLVSPSGAATTINARHDFKGSSQWNVAHPVMKASMLGIRDDIFICGHKHTCGYGVVKSPDDGRISHCLQIGSYKIYDRFARDKGFRDQHISPCVVTVIDPSADLINRIQVFWDAEAGAEYLTFLRSRKR